MRVLLQRVSRAEVRTAGRVVGRVGRGFVLLVGFTHSDGPEQIVWMAEKVVDLRVFPDDEEKMNRSLVDIGGGVLVVSQFTLYADPAKGRRPSFVDAARADRAMSLYESFVGALRTRVHTETGEFGAMMEVELVNDGPVTLWLER